ncbi:ImmA/IrrE family metallo-endopeptidase [Faecalispora jeddahensis]|uniref:ImmA/IrrE family metallo-endopeptidase n=1 Tax=Faecalispora jeddahensis TaxID=1414721 RepID=UPI0027B94243|nr:ImmA/IrrE family metallo-endopeptidase [Faecalispora jeddahensis]
MTPEECAAKVLKDFNINDIPALHFSEICEFHGILWDEFEYNDPKYSGALHKENGEYYILINSDSHNIGRMNFTKAHELGHFFLGHPGEKFECSSSDIFTTDKKNKPYEVEANRFAASFLLPQNKMKLFISDDNYDFSTISGIAANFQTSISAAVIRTIVFLQGSFMAVWAEDSLVQWSVRSPNCQIILPKRQSKVPSKSIAHKCFAESIKPPQNTYIKVPNDTWQSNYQQEKRPLKEMTVFFKNYNATLSVVKS